MSFEFFYDLYYNSEGKIAGISKSMENEEFKTLAFWAPMSPHAHPSVDETFLPYSLPGVLVTNAPAIFFYPVLIWTKLID